jgi:hypothetical protein
MNERSERLGQSQRSDPAGAAGMRFEATVHPGEMGAELHRVADLDLDRVPDPEGGVRLLVTADDCARLLDSGYEVRLHRALPVRPLSGEAVASDESVRDWLAGKVRGIQRAGES